MTEWLADHIEAVIAVLQAFFLAVMWVLHRNFASRGDLGQLRKDVDDRFDASAAEMKTIAAAQTATAGRIELISQTINGLPKADDVAEIKLAIERLSGDQRALKTSVDNTDRHVGSISKSVDRIEGWLMDNRAKPA